MDDIPAKERSQKTWPRYVAIGLLATAILVGLKLIVEHTSWGKENELWVFGKLQTSLSSIDLDNPVVVLDISSLPGGKRGEPTPRKQLEDIIRALSELEPKPRAIAVDVNFSPQGINYSAKEDEGFFDFCLTITNGKKVPVFLAVAETKSAPPEAWLGNGKYKDLAVAAAADKKDTRHIPLWVKSSKSPEKLETLNYALAREYRKNLPGPNNWIKWAVETHHDEDDAVQGEKPIDKDASLIYEDRLVNYSKLDQMRVAATPDITPERIKGSAVKYSNKLVILGDLSSVDSVPIPGRQEDVPGSLVLASATYTLIKEPLFEFKWWVRLGLDFLIAGLIISAVAIIRRRSPDTSWIGKQALFVYVAVVVVLFAGWKLVSWAGILWLDFLLVALALLLHPKMEHVVDQGLEKLRKRPAPVVKTACLILSLLVMTGESSAQEGLFLPVPCADKVAAVGLGLTTPKVTPKRKKVGTCYWRDHKDAQWQSLTPDSVKQQYRAGQHIGCDADCSVTLYFCGTGRQEPISNPRSDYYPIIHAYSDPAPWNDAKPNNLLRQARTFSPADPPLTDRHASAGRLLGAISGITGGAGIAGVAEPSRSEELKVSKKRAEKVVKPSDSREQLKAVGSASGGTSTASSAAAPSAQFLESLSKGNTARLKKDYAVAREHYLAAQQMRPDDYRSFQGLGNVFADEKNWSAAEQAYREALNRRQLNSQLNLSLAFVMMQSMRENRYYGKVDEVEDLLRFASRFMPGDERAYDLYQQLVDVQARDLGQAETFLRRAVLYAPHSANANLRLAQLLYRLDRPGEALTFVRTAEKYAVGEHLLDVANVYRAHGRYKDAERVLQTALGATPNDPIVLYNLGSVMLQRKHYGAALKLLQIAVEKDQNAFAPTLAYGIARFGKGDWAGAETSLDQASRNVAENADGLQRLAYWFSELGDAYSRKRKIADAIRVYEKSIIHAENAEVRHRLLEMKRKREAMQKRGAKIP